MRIQRALASESVAFQQSTTKRVEWSHALQQGLPGIPTGTYAALERQPLGLYYVGALSEDRADFEFPEIESDRAEDSLSGASGVEILRDHPRLRARVLEVRIAADAQQTCSDKYSGKRFLGTNFQGRSLWTGQTPW